MTKLERTWQYQVLSTTTSLVHPFNNNTAWSFSSIQSRHKPSSSYCVNCWQFCTRAHSDLQTLSIAERISFPISSISSSRHDWVQCTAARSLRSIKAVDDFYVQVIVTNMELFNILSWLVGDLCPQGSCINIGTIEALVNNYRFPGILLTPWEILVDCKVSI
jgi:hypothetical protein